MKAIVSEKGQITVPKTVRDRMGLRPGDELDVVEEHGQIVARKVSRSDPIDSVYGIVELPGGTDAFIRDIRGPGPDDHGS